LKKLYTFLLALTVVLITAVGVYSLVDVDATSSEMEKRELARMPAFSVGGLLDGSYLRQMDEYYSDTFPGREVLLKANRFLNQFYYYSGSGENSLLIVDYTGNAANGGEALRNPEEHQQEAMAPVTIPEHSASEQMPEETVPEETAPEENKPEETAPEENTSEETKPEENKAEETNPEENKSEENKPEENDPEETDPVSSEDPQAVTSVGTIIIQGDRAMEIPTATESVILRYAEAMNNLQDALGKKLRIISLLTPNSGQFYSPEDFHTGLHDQKIMIDLCYDAMDRKILTVDAYSALEAHQSEYIYFRTDHHWTALGAYYAYTALCQQLELEAVPLEQFETGVYDRFLGSLYTWTSGYAQSSVLKENPDSLTYYMPVVETHAKYYADAELDEGYPVSVVYRGLKETEGNKYLCFLGGDHPAAVVETAVEDGPVCLVLKESYGNALIPFLTGHYSKIYVIDPREFNRSGKPDLDLEDFVKEHNVDDLLVVNYPFMINNLDYIKWLNRLVGIDME